jgi:hypothetical protein
MIHGGFFSLRIRSNESAEAATGSVEGTSHTPGARIEDPVQHRIRRTHICITGVKSKHDACDA